MIYMFKHLQERASIKQSADINKLLRQLIWHQRKQAKFVKVVWNDK